MDKFCSLKKHYQEPSKPYNLISTTFFLTDNMYKDPIKKYVNGLKASVENFFLHFDKSYMMRIYYDNSVLEKIHKTQLLNDAIDDIKNFIKELKEQPRIQLVEFNCKNFKKDKLHIGMFPTFLRFDPLFDDKSKIKTVIISDIEASSIYDLKVLLEYSNNHPKAKLAWRSNPFTNPTKPQKDWIYAGSFLSHVKFDRSLLDKFFSEISDDKSRISKFIEKIKSKQADIPKFQKMKFKELGSYPYGVDEAFLNFYLKPVFKEKKYPVFYFAKAHNIYRLFANHYKANKKYEDFDKKETDNINAFYSLIFGPSIVDMSKSARENYSKINEILYPSMDFKFREVLSKNIKKNYDTIEKNLDKVRMNRDSLNSLKIFSELLEYVVYQDEYKPVPKEFVEKPNEDKKEPATKPASKKKPVSKKKKK
jgi:hypothetical protein